MCDAVLCHLQDQDDVYTVTGHVVNTKSSQGVLLQLLNQWTGSSNAEENVREHAALLKQQREGTSAVRDARMHSVLHAQHLSRHQNKEWPGYTRFNTKVNVRLTMVLKQQNEENRVRVRAQQCYCM